MPVASFRQVARALTPAPVRRGLFNACHALGMRAEPDRIFLEHRIVPWLSGRATEVLFVGCRAYTRHYDLLFRRRRMTLWTMDIDPAAAPFGADGGRHRIGDVTAPLVEQFPLRFDAVILNGVIGWGVDDPARIALALQRIAAIAKPGAPVVIGWNEDRSVDPMGLADAAKLFEPNAGPVGKTRVKFEDSTHVYDFVETLVHAAATTAINRAPRSPRRSSAGADRDGGAAIRHCEYSP